MSIEYSELGFFGGFCRGGGFSPPGLTFGGGGFGGGFCLSSLRWAATPSESPATTTKLKNKCFNLFISTVLFFLSFSNASGKRESASLPTKAKPVPESTL